jgi:hypothetical protein
VLRSFMTDSWTKARKPVELPDLLAAIHRLLSRRIAAKSHNAAGRNLRPPDARSDEDRTGEFRLNRLPSRKFQLIDGGITRHSHSRN